MSGRNKRINIIVIRAFVFENIDKRHITCIHVRIGNATYIHVYERCGMRGRGSGVGCGVVERVIRSILRFGHNERMGNEEFVKKVYLSSVEGPNKRGRPLGRWEDRVKEYVSERGVLRGNMLEWARRECMARERRRSVCRGHPLVGRFRRERGVGAID